MLRVEVPARQRKVGGDGKSLLLKPESLLEAIGPHKKVCPCCLSGDLKNVVFDCGYCRRAPVERVARLLELDPECEFFEIWRRFPRFPIF